MKTYGGMEDKLHSFLNLALDGGKWSASIPLPHFPLGRDTHLSIEYEAEWAP